ncbi:hypothetical protein vBKpnF48_155 [Klebsiella phage vB_Kpn_F48]|uniref:Uncharacterized protein n=2 Tax=Marfavirus F48 TaxID=2845079 RepID=A0A2I6UFM8_9CAUD|nr:tail fiber assembly protein [Klebsiella phage vB_Kpn_F48]AUO78780.1 hypothetical protein vBKpnF48_155 [Klebsiella phage vB_Kpn_F48]QGZ15288.1 hypothetical protein [Klebsiella phage vB_Kpn_P545]WKC55747.1 hypothetical protein R31_27 [Klebsiella phage R3_1]
MILNKALSVNWSHNFDGGAYYKDENGECWYKLRKNFVPNKPVILVDKPTRKIINYYCGPDISMIGLYGDSNIVLDIYQLDEFPAKDWDDFSSRQFKFENDKVEEIIIEQKDKTRSKDDILADLMKLKAELEAL